MTVLARGAVRLVAPVAVLLLVDLVGLGSLGVGRAPVELVLALGLAGLLGFLLVFFRDPERPVGEGIVSAADGRVRAVDQDGDRWTVSVFLSPLDVHVNRLPLDAVVEAVETRGAGHRPAYDPSAAGNVRRHYRLRTSVGPVEVVQVTGLVARRLVSFVRPGAAGRKGDRFGMIVLGSRTDVVLPSATTVPSVRVGDRVRAGTSTIARIVP